MSRVMVVNVPPDATVSSLRSFLTASLPPSAPVVEVTDCFIRRPRRQGAATVAFVGCRSVAAGPFLVKHFDGAVFMQRRLRLRVSSGMVEAPPAERRGSTSAAPERKRRREETEGKETAVGDAEEPSWKSAVMVPPTEVACAAEQPQHVAAATDADFLAAITVGEDPKPQSVDVTPDEDTTKSAHEEVVVEQPTARIMIVNIPYSTTEADVRNAVSSMVGPIESVHIPHTRDTKTSRGIAFVRFSRVEDASAAIAKLHQRILWGRIVRVTAARAEPQPSPSRGSATAHTSYQREAQERGKSTVWNAAFVANDAAVEAVAKDMGTTAGDLINPTTRGAAVRAAVAEALVVSAARRVLGNEGIDLTAIERASTSPQYPRSDVCLLVKQLPPATTAATLLNIFQQIGAVDAVAVPESGLFALVRFAASRDAQSALRRWAFRRLPGGAAPLLIEWAPLGALRPPTDDGGATKGGVARTAYITNLPFGVGDEALKHFIVDRCAALSDWVAQPASAPYRLTHLANAGRAFLSVPGGLLDVVVAALNGADFDGRVIACTESNATRRATTTAADDEDPLRIVVKNLPFEATEADLREMFGAFVEVRAVRVPKKPLATGAAHRRNNHRGFGFVEVVSEQEAQRAMEALRDTHLYGRHLVLQYAKRHAV